MIGVLGLSHRDTQQAQMWIRWVSDLGSTGPNRLMIVSGHSSRVPSAQIQGFEVSYHKVPVVERGYPGSASHLFVLGMKLAGEIYPNEPLLWLEADAIPTSADWFDAIASEYAEGGNLFMGHLEATHAIPHLAGVAVYPPNWQELSPMLASSHIAPDIPYFGRGKGQAFDAYAAPEVFPQSRQARTIYQVFGKRTWRHSDLSLVPSGVKLIHQSKDGSLIRCLKRTHV